MKNSPYHDYDAIICDGAVRSGKTLSMAVSFFLWAMTSFSGRQFGLCGKTISGVRRNILADVLPNLRGLGFECSEKLSQNKVTVRVCGRVNDFFIFGGRDEGSAALVQGATFAGVLLDEVALMPQSFVEQACARCSVSGSRLWFNCNPEGPSHWFYTGWVKNAEARGALYLHFTMDDNPSLSPKIKARYKAMYSGVFYRRFVLGEWVVAKGRVYDFYDSESAVPAPSGLYEKWYISCDYGTANPASFGLWGLMDGIWYRVAEYYWDSRRQGGQKTDAEYAAQLRKLAGGRSIEAVVVDPSAASFIEALRRDGWRVRKADNDVLSGIRLTADLLKSGRVVICAECADALREIEAYCWDERAGGMDTVKKENDHAMDDMRYFCMTVVGGEVEDFAVFSVER